MSTYEQFLVFINDSVGLERTLRLLQSIALITASYSTPLHILLSLLSLAPSSSPAPASPSPAATRTILLAIIQRLNLTRRFFRLFKFFHSFNVAQKLYATDLDRQGWVDGLGSTFMGLYLLLDASLIVDALKIDGLRVWTPEREKIITVESQRLWLFALVCGLLSALLKMVDVMAYQPAPATGDVFSKGDKVVDDADEKEEKEANSSAAAEKKKVAVIAKKDAKAKEVRRQLRALQRDALANALDIVLPGVVVGWIHVGPGAVGLAMFATTILTGMSVWERCGKAVRGGK